MNRKRSMVLTAVASCVCLCMGASWVFAQASARSRSGRSLALRSASIAAKVVIPAKPSRKLNFAKLIPVKAEVFKRRSPAKLRASIKRKFPLKLAVEKVKVFKKMDYMGRKPMLRKAVLAKFPLKPFKPFVLVKRPLLHHFVRIYDPKNYPNGRVVIVIPTSLYNQCKVKLNRYIGDISQQGYFGQIMLHKGGSAVNLKNKLKKVGDLAGAILVGNIPTAWYENNNDFHGNHSQFPCDLYLMDMNGNWTDADNDGMYDNHTGNVEPEIWIARWSVHQLSGTAASRLNSWLNRNHAIRLGNKGFSLNACAFVDDDWASWGRCSMDLMLRKSRVEKFNVRNQTTAVNYKGKLGKKLNWLHFCCHSSPWHHKTYQDKGKVNYKHIRGANKPHAFFYQLFNCSSARFTEKDFLGGYYVFGNGPYSLAAVGSTKSGSMKAFEHFYGPMGDGRLIGEAFVDWFVAQAPYNLHDKRWYYGMCLLGDPLTNWTTPVIPRQLSPKNGQVYKHYPRKTTLKWKKVGLNMFFWREYRYEVQVDFKYGNKWALNDGHVYKHIKNLSKTTYRFNFVGAQPGRWRVRAVRNKGKVKCPWSPWRTFRYTR